MEFDLPGQYEGLKFLWQPTINKFILKGERKRPSDIIGERSNSWYGSFRRGGSLPTPINYHKHYATSFEDGIFKVKMEKLAFELDEQEE